MKVNFDIECTPEEARKFFGLPDVVPMQDALMKQLQDKLSDNIRSLDAESLARTWIPITMQGWSEMQKMFWGQVGGAQSMPGTNPFSFATDAMRATSEMMERSAGKKPKTKKNEV